MREPKLFRWLEDNEALIITISAIVLLVLFVWGFIAGGK